MAFLAQRGLPDHLSIRILEQAGFRSVPNVCATDCESLQLIHRIQCDFPVTWHRKYDPRAPPSLASLEGVRRVKISGDKPNRWHPPQQFSSGIAAQFPPSLRSLRIEGEPSAEIWDVLPNLEHLHALRLEKRSLMTDLRVDMLPPNLHVLHVIDCRELVSVHLLPAQLECLSVCGWNNEKPVPYV